MNNDDIQMSSSNNFDGVNDKTIPVDVSSFREVHTVEVTANTEINLHAHKHPVFRYITSGTMQLNGTPYNKGDWMLVPGDTEYKIIAGDDGYTALCFCAIWDEK